ncbi:MAG: ABC transporter ATP-binding protein [Gammaproteobacteria bacterium]|nr:ABC transporter ATP-binding protein [Gammaproteobacteria bacterium]
MSSDSLLVANNLYYAYQEAGQSHTVIDDASIAINKGEWIALLGASGSGKSTLLNLLAGIDRANSGQVTIAGQQLSCLQEPQLTLFRRRHIGFIYQLFHLIPTLNVFENIALPLELCGVQLDQRLQQVSDWLSKIGLQSRAQAFPDQLSGGEQQRVAIARALIHQPMLVLADEPTGNLDAETGARILDLLTGLAEQNQQTLIMVTHSETVASRAHRVLEMHSGRLKTASKDLAW